MSTLRGMALARMKVRARVSRFLTTPLVIKRGDLGAFDPLTGKVGGLSNASTVYSGPGRIHTITGQGSVVAGDGEFDTRQVIISIPWDAPEPARDDMVILGVETGGADPDLAGGVYRVMEVNGGSLFNESTQLSCVTWHPSRYWGEQ